MFASTAAGLENWPRNELIYSFFKILNITWSRSCVVPFTMLWYYYVNTHEFSIKILQQLNSLIVHVEMLSCTELGTLDGCHLLAVHWSVQAGRQLRGCHPLYKPNKKEHDETRTTMANVYKNSSKNRANKYIQ